VCVCVLSKQNNKFAEIHPVKASLTVMLFC